MAASTASDEIQAQWFRPTKPKEELFDTENDPHELHSLAADPAYADKFAELRTELDRWMQEIDDKALCRNPSSLSRSGPA